MMSPAFRLLICWVGGCSTVMFGGMRAMGFLRLSDEEQTTGLDIIEHGGPSYPEFTTINMATEAKGLPGKRVEP